MVSTFLKMAKDFSPDFNVFYNGPESGASAPDHLHFQATARGILPIEKEIVDRARLALVKCIHAIPLFRAKNVGREVIIMEGGDSTAIGDALTSIVSAMKSVLSSPAEPQMNLLGSYERNTWRIVIFPRQRHRPSVYFLPGNERILISPGLVEMGGIIVTPIGKDFDIVNEELIRKIYTEVSVGEETIQKILEAPIPLTLMNMTAIVDSRMTFEEATAGTRAPREIIDKLCLVDVRYRAFDGRLHQGQLIIHQEVKDGHRGNFWATWSGRRFLFFRLCRS